jgi:hypothetical protein
MIRRLPVIVLLAVLSLATAAWAADVQGLTWDELKQVQATERAELLKAQTDQLQMLVDREKDEMEAMRKNGFTGPVDIDNLAKKHAEERKDLARVNSEERATLAKTHAEERKAFLAAQQETKKSR